MGNSRLFSILQYGHIHRCVRSLIKEKFGSDMWNSILYVYINHKKIMLPFLGKIKHV